MELQACLKKVQQEPEQIEFTETIAAVEANYNLTETAFKNGTTYNEAGQNNGSCKLFALAKLHSFTPEQTLACFGQYYQDVLLNPTGDDHQNIRNFIQNGWDGIKFEDEALVEK